MAELRTVLDYALFYRALGWSVIPVQPGKKRPLLRWLRYQELLPDEAEIRSWFERRPEANVAVVTGAVSGLVVLDVDPGHGGEESLLDLEGRHGRLPETVEAITGGGGRHLYFRHPGRPCPNRVGLAPGIDLRGDGGYVVAPPSLHPSGRRYVWEVSHHPEDRALAPLPPWLLRLVLQEGPRRGHPPAHWRELLRRGVREGERNNTIASLTGHLLHHGVDVRVIEELLQCWNLVRCDPPLDPEEVARTVASIERTHERHRLEQALAAAWPAAAPRAIGGTGSSGADPA